MTISRRTLLQRAAATLALGISDPLRALAQAAEGPETPEDRARLVRWVTTLRTEGLDRTGVPFGRAVARAGELALGTPYEAYTLEAYVKSGGDPLRREPLTLWLTRFDCVTLVESALAVARVAAQGVPPRWDAFGRQVERMRYRGGTRAGYTSRLHYFSEWIADNARRGLVRDLGAELGGEPDRRPLRFMSTHRESYPALRSQTLFEAIAAHERRLDDAPRWVVPTAKIPQAADRIRTGDVLAFATSIEGLDATHTGLAYRDRENVLRVLHAPLSGGVVQVSKGTLAEYVGALKRGTGIMVARPDRS